MKLLMSNNYSLFLCHPKTLCMPSCHTDIHIRISVPGGYTLDTIGSPRKQRLAKNSNMHRMITRCKSPHENMGYSTFKHTNL